MADHPTPNLDLFIENVARNNAATATTVLRQYAGRNEDASWVVPDYDTAVSKFRFPERQTVDGNDQPFECNGDLYRWIWTYTLPQHPLCRAYLDAHRQYQYNTNGDIQPVQIWAVSEFEAIWTRGEANKAVFHLEKYGCPFHSRIICAPVGHAPPLLGIPHVGATGGTLCRGRPNRGYHTSASGSSTNRNGSA